MVEARYVLPARCFSKTLADNDMLLTVGGRIIVGTEAEWAEFGAARADLLRVPATTEGMPVSMLGSPAARSVRWWEDEDR